MKIITNEDLQNAMNEIRPSLISVAYIGKDWRSYIDEHELNEIVVSPTIGSNPLAIAQVVKILGWDSVHLLDSLHTKLYIGKTSAAFGSFNLSRNGISAGGLEELGAITDDPHHISRLNSEFARLKALAKVQYPTAQHKEERLQELWSQRNHAIAEGVIGDDNPLIQINNYALQDTRVIHIMWWRDIKVVKNYEALSAADDNIKEESFDNIVGNWTTALEKDNIQPGSWVLMWKARDDGMPSLNKQRPYWLYVHETVPHAIKEDNYTKIILQRKDKIIPTPPFDLNRAEVSEALKAILGTEEFSSFRENNGAPWSANSCVEYTNKLIATLHIACRNIAPIET